MGVEGKEHIFPQLTWTYKRIFIQPADPNSKTFLTVRKPLCVKIRTAETSLPEAGDGGKMSLEGRSGTLRSSY